MATVAEKLFVLGGLRIVETPFLTVRKQVRFPRSRKRRIQKKWRRNFKNWGDVPGPSYLLNDDTIYMHPDSAKRLRSKIDRRNRMRDRTVTAVERLAGMGLEPRLT